ncbi:hypothetical protein [uncultured Holdemanella sp.]|mgnify:FL=1|uniref:hypothetical protein n=1 Tax=uncultured Holdemanella sp. TaxID=1763549 RepID=UPI0025E891D2|nr:hypothetical protein [uncultured Holdemanella sp.]
MGDYVVIGLVGVLVILMSILPKPVYNAITRVFSMHKNGIRKIRKYNSTTDSIANLLITISIVFSIFYCFIPFYSILYAIFFIVSYLCLLAQANRVTSKKTQSVARTVIFLTNLFSGISFLGALGFLNQHISDAVIAQFMIDFQAHKVFDILYLLQNRTWMYWLFQGILFLFPLFIMWSHFKYMRLENSVKAVYFVTYIIKMIFLIVVVLLVSYGTFEFLDKVYQVDALRDLA